MRHAREDYNRFQDPENKIPEDEPVMLFRAQDEYARFALEGYVDAIKNDQQATAEAVDIAIVVQKFLTEFNEWSVQKSPDL